MLGAAVFVSPESKNLVKKPSAKKSPETALKLSKSNKKDSKSRSKVLKNYPPKRQNTLKKSPENATKLSTEAIKCTQKLLKIVHGSGKNALKIARKCGKTIYRSGENALKKSPEAATKLSTEAAKIN
jgi:hypothetical protein